MEIYDATNFLIIGYSLAIAIGFLAIFWLVIQPWLWGIVFLLCALASGLAMIASVIYFQILAAVGYWVLAMILGALGASLLD